MSAERSLGRLTGYSGGTAAIERGGQGSWDLILLFCVLALSVIGIVFIYSSSLTASGEPRNAEYLRQIAWVSSGLLLLVGTAMLDYRRLTAFSPIVYVVVLFALLLVTLFGREINGSRSWVGIGNLGIQPSELMKVATILMLGLVLDRWHADMDRLTRFVLALAVGLFPALLVLLQDLGTALVFVPITIVMVYIGGARTRHVLLFVSAAGLALLLLVLPFWREVTRGPNDWVVRFFADRRLTLTVFVAFSAAAGLSLLGLAVLRRAIFWPFAWVSLTAAAGLLLAIAAREVLQSHQIMRLIVFVDPYIDPQGAGWNVIQSLNAVGSGGLAGKGFLQGTQSQLQFLPQQSTDFIFSIIAEEWGFLGVLLVFGLFAVLLLRIVRVGMRASDRLGAVICAGVGAYLFFHLSVNVGMASGIMPVMGIPLVFVSYGGSSAWASLAAIGLVISVRRNRSIYS